MALHGQLLVDGCWYFGDAFVQLPLCHPVVVLREIRQNRHALDFLASKFRGKLHQFLLCTASGQASVDSGKLLPALYLRAQSVDSLSSQSEELSSAMVSALSFHPFSGQALQPHLEALGGLRIAVFKEFPYLYEGTLEYEKNYLQTYVNCPLSLVVLACDGEEVVGATTCLPLTDEGPEFQSAFVNAGLDLAEYCYFGESILLPKYRGHGVGRDFMMRRETHARSLPGVKYCTFCAVERSVDHPLRPVDYQPLDAFWGRVGFFRQPQLATTFTWKETGEEQESAKKMVFWIKALA